MGESIDLFSQSSVDTFAMSVQRQNTFSDGEISQNIQQLIKQLTTAARTLQFQQRGIDTNKGFWDEAVAKGDAAEAAENKKRYETAVDLFEATKGQAQLKLNQLQNLIPTYKDRLDEKIIADYHACLEKVRPYLSISVV